VERELTEWSSGLEALHARRAAQMLLNEDELRDRAMAMAEETRQENIRRTSSS